MEEKREERGEYNVKNQIIEIAIFVIAVVTISTLALTLLGFIAGGFTEAGYVSFWQFYAPFVFFLLGIIAIDVVEILTKGKWARMPIHDSHAPHILGKLPVVKKVIVFLFISLTIAGWLSFIGTLTETAYTPTRLVAQQAAPIAQIWGAVEPAATMETLLMMFSIGLLFTIGLVIVNLLKGNIKVWIYVIAVIVVFLIAFEGMGIHMLKYGADEGDLMATFNFWGLSAVGVVLTGSVIFMWVLHLFNNLFAQLFVMFARDTFIILSILGLTFLTIITVLIVLWTRRKRVKIR